MLPRLFAILLFAAALATAHSAAAVEPLTITSLKCENLGAGKALCDATVTGGTGSYTYTWSKLVGGTPMNSWTTTDGSTMTGCTVGTTNYFRLVVQDSAGATASATRGVYCTRIVP
ncbi:MAG TPA: hypothetical protein VGD69_07535 [Herpetosiphonaceae bacterium]